MSRRKPVTATIPPPAPAPAAVAELDDPLLDEELDTMDGEPDWDPDPTPAVPPRPAVTYPEAVTRVNRKPPKLASDAELAKALALDPAILSRMLKKACMRGTWGQQVPSGAELVRRILHVVAMDLDEPTLVKTPSTLTRF